LIEMAGDWGFSSAAWRAEGAGRLDAGAPGGVG